jgi:SAM-dependent methyltransferase
MGARADRPAGRLPEGQVSSESYSVEKAAAYGWGPDSPPDPQKADFLLRQARGSSVLDVGCASGTYVDLLARQGFEATGLESFPDFLREAAAHGRQGRFVEGHAQSMPFPDKSFDTTVLFDVLEHVDDRLAVREAIRVTRARILVLVPLQDPVELLQNNFVFQHHRDRTHLREYSIDGLRRMFADHGGAVEVVEPAYPANVRGLFADSLRLPRAGRLFVRAALRPFKRLFAAHFSQVFLVVNLQPSTPPEPAP